MLNVLPKLKIFNSIFLRSSFWPHESLVERGRHVHVFIMIMFMCCFEINKFKIQTNCVMSKDCYNKKTDVLYFSTNTFDNNDEKTWNCKEWKERERKKHSRVFIYTGLSYYKGWDKYLSLSLHFAHKWTMIVESQREIEKNMKRLRKRVTKNIKYKVIFSSKTT